MTKGKPYNRETSRIDATEHFTRRFEEKRREYPLVPHDNPGEAQRVLDDYENGVSPYVSYPTAPLPQAGTLSRILSIAIGRSIDRDDPRFVIHAAEGHPLTYQEAGKRLLVDVQDPLHFNLTPDLRKVDMGRGLTPVNRLTLTGREYEKTIARPLPCLLAHELSSARFPNAKAQERALLAIGKEDFATLVTTAMYMGMSGQDWVDLWLRRKQIRAEMAQIHGLKGPILPAQGNRVQASRLFSQIRAEICGPNDIETAFVPGRYHNAVDLIAQQGVDVSTIRTFVPAPYTAEPIMPFRMMLEVAEPLFDIRFNNPARQAYIDRHGLSQFATTNPVTLYLKIGTEPTQRQFYDQHGRPIPQPK